MGYSQDDGLQGLLILSGQVIEARATETSNSAIEAKLRQIQLREKEYMLLICPLQSGPKVNLDWTLKETKNGQEARA
jgi:hypothetical protein